MATPDKTQKGVLEMGYQTTLMYGSYARSLGEYAKEQATEIRRMEKSKEAATAKTKTLKDLHLNYSGWLAHFVRGFAYCWGKTFAKVGEDWVFLALLGVIMALISFTMDTGIYMCNSARLWMYNEIKIHPALQYLAWITLPVFLVLFAAGFVFIVAPQAVGSGIPEMKTIMRGVVLKEYLTFRTLIAKTVGLTAALGSGMPLGKEGPLVHIGSIVGTVLSQLLTSFKGIYENESRNSDMLAAACAVGVSCSLGAPIGGVLFSIEVTSVYFAIRNYWRGFFSAVFSALMFRLMAYWFNTEETLTAVFPTNFQVDFPYDPHELFIFALIGVFGGLAGALFVLLHRRYVLFMRNNKRISTFLKYNRFIYPSLVAVFIASMFYPPGFGRYLATTQTNKQQISTLFSNFTWLSDDLTVEQADRLSHWDVENTNLFVSLGIFMMSTFFLNIIASTLPVPTGSLIPIFKMGAAFGRMIGEAMHLWFPEGIRTGTIISPILPGGYAIVGAAAFSAGVTHTVSICVVVAEMTGQIHHIIPILIAVLVSNAISTLLQPSLYESIIMIKKLPYLPSILPSRSAAHSIYVESFMNRDIKYIWTGITYRELKNIIIESQGIRSFPLLDNPGHMILLGSVQRIELISLLERHLGPHRRLEYAAQLHKEAELREERERKAKLILPPIQPIPIRAPSPLQKPEEAVIQEPLVPTIPVRRKVSRFEVITSPNTSASPVSDVDTSNLPGQPSPSLKTPDQLPSDPVTRITVEPDDKDGSATAETQPQRPIKSILKRTSSFSLSQGERSRNSNLDNISIATSTYSTVTGAEGRKFRNVIENFLRKQAEAKDTEKSSFLNSMTGIPTANPAKKVNLVTVPKTKGQLMDLTSEEKEEWEEREMQKPVNLKECAVDPAPFQLVEHTSLVKVHSIFSLLGVHHAYVTTLGKLVGIVSLKELRKAIEDVNSSAMFGRSPDKVTGTPNPQNMVLVQQATQEDNKSEESQSSESSNLDTNPTSSTCRHVQFRARPSSVILSAGRNDTSGSTDSFNMVITSPSMENLNDSKTC